MMFFFSSVAFSQGKGDENALLKIEEPKEEQIDIIMSTLETAKSGQIKIDKSSEELAEEKEKIEQQKTELITNGSGLEAEDPELKKQLKLLEKKQQFIEANEKAIEERIQATERTMALIERKIQIINNENLTLNDIRREDRKIRKALKADEKEKVFTMSQIPLISIEIKGIEKEIAGQKMILELKKEDQGAVKEAIKANEARLDTAQKEIALINERIAFINVQIEIAKDYLSVLWEKRLDIMKNKMFVFKPYAFKLLDAVFLFCLFLCVPIRSIIWRKKTEKNMQKEELSSDPGMPTKIIKWAMLYSAGYFILSFVGYHQLAIYITYRIVLVAVVAFILFLAKRLVNIVFKKILFQGEEGSRERVMMKTFLGIASTLLNWALFFLGVFIVFEILGLRHEAIESAIRIAQKPLFIMGNIKLKNQKKKDM